MAASIVAAEHGHGEASRTPANPAHVAEAGDDPEANAQGQPQSEQLTNRIDADPAQVQCFQVHAVASNLASRF